MFDWRRQGTRSVSPQPTGIAPSPPPWSSPFNRDPGWDLLLAALSSPRQQSRLGANPCWGSPGLERVPLVLRVAVVRAPSPSLGLCQSSLAVGGKYPSGPLCETALGLCGPRPYSQPLCSGSCFQSQRAEFSLWFLGPVRVNMRPPWVLTPSASIARPAGSRNWVFFCR